jgi:hypothetical protein
MSCNSNRETGLCKNLGVNQPNAYCCRRVIQIKNSNNAISLDEFLSEENLEKMTKDELMKLWEFILSDFDRLNVEYKIRKILDLRK